MKRADAVLLMFCISFVLIFGVWILAKPQTSFSEHENRVLVKFPELSADGISNGSFFDKISSFYRDQFPMRNKFTDIKARFTLLLGASENNGVLFGKDGYLMIKPQYENLDNYKRNLAAISDFCRKYEELGIKTEVVLAPRAVDVLTDYLPRYYANGQSEELWQEARAAIPKMVDTRPEISELSEKSVWYKTDHHWNAYGAYAAYTSAAKVLGFSPISPEKLKKETVSDEFCGTVYSKSGISHGVADTLFLLRYEEDCEYVTVNFDTGESLNGFYDFEKLDIKDKYSVFLGGNCGHMGIYSEDDAQEKIMVVKDSFANSMMPFLAYNADIELYDLRYFEGKLSDEIVRCKPSKILIIYGIDTIVTDPSPRLLLR